MQTVLVFFFSIIIKMQISESTHRDYVRDPSMLSVLVTQFQIKFCHTKQI
jgi:hypothetical protein